MADWLGLLVNIVLGLFGLQRKTPAVKAEERAGRAETNLQSERVARAETAAVIDARRAVDAERLRDLGTGSVTTDVSAPINQDDGFRRD